MIKNSIESLIIDLSESKPFVYFTFVILNEYSYLILFVTKSKYTQNMTKTDYLQLNVTKIQDLLESFKMLLKNKGTI